MPGARSQIEDPAPAELECVEMFTLHHGICPNRIVNRIEFGYVETETHEVRR